MTDPVSQRVGERIRRARREQGLSLAALGGEELTRGFLSAVETGHSSISLKALALVATRLHLPVSYFVDDRPVVVAGGTVPDIDHARAALAYGQYLRSVGETEEALDYALWAAISFASESREERR
jgi:transcriptional regulator with XRE-family HTH domain